MLGNDGAADAVTLFQHQNYDVHPFIVVNIVGQVGYLGDEFAGFKIGVFVGCHQLFEGDGFGDHAAVVEVVVHLVVVALILSFLHDIDGDGVALLADKAFQFFVIVAVEVDFAVFVHRNIL